MGVMLLRVHYLGVPSMLWLIKQEERAYDTALAYAKHRSRAKVNLGCAAMARHPANETQARCLSWRIYGAVRCMRGLDRKRRQRRLVR